MKEKLTIYLDEDLLTLLNEEAALNSVSRSMIVNNHLRMAYQTLNALAKHELIRKTDIYQDLQEELFRRKLLTLHYLFQSMHNFKEVKENVKEVAEDLKRVLENKNETG